MNKYIKTDLENAEKYMKSAIMNALHDIDSGEEKRIDLGNNISWNLFLQCLDEANWNHDDDVNFDTNGWEIDFWDVWWSPSGKCCDISGSLCGQSYQIHVNTDE